VLKTNSAIDNHQPNQTTSRKAAIKPTNSGYSLSMKDGDEIYKYNGTRTSGEYVLVFDSERRTFVMHKVDSQFNFNLVSTPWQTDSKALRDQYKQLAMPVEREDEMDEDNPYDYRKFLKDESSDSETGTPTGTNEAEEMDNSDSDANDDVASTRSLPKEPVREVSEEKNDEDDVLEIEYPDGPTRPFGSFQSPIRPSLDGLGEDEDSDDEMEDNEEGHDEIFALPDQDVKEFELGPPANHPEALQDIDNDPSLADLEADLHATLEGVEEVDLEADLAAALGANLEESDESEEE
jgi:hypothetical protein